MEYYNLVFFGLKGVVYKYLWIDAKNSYLENYYN